MLFRERSLRVKNRMREIRSSGSVRGGAGNIPAYSAGGLDDRAIFARCLVESIESGIGVGLHQRGIASKMLLGMLAAEIGRVEGRSWRIGGGEETIIEARK
jgi:hypothetical protein